jgi:hypothetical protein
VGSFHGRLGSEGTLPRAVGREAGEARRSLPCDPLGGASAGRDPAHVPQVLLKGGIVLLAEAGATDAPVNHVERRPDPKLSPSGPEGGIQVLSHEVAEERVRQDPLETRTDLQPHGLGSGVVEQEQAAAAGLPAYSELAHRGQGESLWGKAAGVGSEDDADVDAGLDLHPVQVLVVLPLVAGRDEADAIVHPPGPGPASEPRPGQGEQQDVNGDHQQQDRAANRHGNGPI